MVKASGVFIFTSLVLSALAVDIDMYPDSNSCDLDEDGELDFITCEDIPEGNCCYEDMGIFLSCEANNPQKTIQAFVQRNDGGSPCNILLGGSDLCWGVSDDIARITGCEWREFNAKRDIAVGQATDPNNEKECRRANMRGRKIGGKSYLLDMAGQGYQESLNLTSSADKNEFFMRKADKIRDNA